MGLFIIIGRKFCTISSFFLTLTNVLTVPKCALQNPTSNLFSLIFSLDAFCDHALISMLLLSFPEVQILHPVHMKKSYTPLIGRFTCHTHATFESDSRDEINWTRDYSAYKGIQSVIRRSVCLPKQNTVLLCAYLFSSTIYKCVISAIAAH